MASLDKLIWGIAADSMTAVTTQLGILVTAARDDDELAEVAQSRIDTLRAMGSMAQRKADDFERELRGDRLPSPSEIASEFSEGTASIRDALDNE
jgi:hypothetical protein